MCFEQLVEYSDCKKVLLVKCGVRYDWKTFEIIITNLTSFFGRIKKRKKKRKRKSVIEGSDEKWRNDFVGVDCACSSMHDSLHLFDISRVNRHFEGDFERRRSPAKWKRDHRCARKRAGMRSRSISTKTNSTSTYQSCLLRIRAGSRSSG